MKTLDELKYAPFHNHTSYSDGFPTVIKSVNQAVKCNLPGLGITDHGTCAGIPEHWMTCNEHNIKPILGSEIYLRIPESWQELGESRNSKSGRYHATLITTNFEGYKRLIAINNAAHRNMEESRGKKYPITTIDMLQEYAGEGLIALTGCVASVTFHDQIIIAEEYVNFLIKYFGKSNVYAEIMPHIITRFDGQQLNGFERPLYLSEKFGIKTVYSTDAHASTKEELPLLASYTKAMKGYEFTAASIQSKEEDFKDAVAVIGKEKALIAFNGNDEIFNRIEEVNFKRNFQLPESSVEIEAMKEYLKVKLEDDINEFSGKVMHNGNVITRIILEKQFQQEWNILEKYKFWGYFAVLWDMLKIGHEQGALTVARGSASGSYILYLLGITQLHPIQHGLMFERFLAELRLETGELPDVDVDISENDRHIIQEYAKERWGFEPVGTVLTYAHSGAVRVIDRIYSNITGNELSDNLVADASDKGEESEEFKKFISIQPWMLPMYNGLLGSISGYGAHACAVVPIDPEMPVPMEAWGKGIVVNYSESGGNKTLQMLGLVKYDLLSSSNLATIKLLSEITGIKPPKVIEDNNPCFTVFEKEDLTGLFQFDTRVGRNLINLMIKNGQKINSIRTLSDLTSLGRPGPLHENYHIAYAERTADITKHPDFIKEVFKQTNGVLIYQEQVAELFARVAFKEYDKNAKEYGIVALKSLVPKNAKLAETDKFKAGYEKMHKMFIKGGEDHHGLDVFYLEELFASLVGFIRYGFNLSHSLSYANISAQEAWYKYYYPQAFWSVILEGVSNSKEERGKLLRYIVDATLKSGLEFRPPHINTASLGYKLLDDNKTIQCPITMMKGMGASNVNEILSNQPFNNLQEINEKTKLNKSIKLAMYNAGMLKGLEGDLYSLGVCEIKEFKSVEEAQYEHNGLIEKIEAISNVMFITVNNVKYSILSEHSDEIKAIAKKSKIKLSTSGKLLKIGTEILFNAHENVIMNYKRVRYFEPEPEAMNYIEAIKASLGFAIPQSPSLYDYFKYAEGKEDKIVGYIVEIETRKTDKTTQHKLTLQNGRGYWFCIEDRTTKGFIMASSKIKSLDEVKHLEVGDLVGLTLVMTKDKQGNIMTYNQIKEFKLLA